MIINKRRGRTAVDKNKVDRRITMKNVAITTMLKPWKPERRYGTLRTMKNSSKLCTHWKKSAENISTNIKLQRSEMPHLLLKGDKVFQGKHTYL